MWWTRLAGYAAGVSLSLVVLASSGLGDDRRDPTRGPAARPLPKDSRSEGFPWRGRLRRAVPIRESAYLRYTSEYERDGNFWGTWELVQLVERAAYRVHQRLPGSRLSIGEASRQRGGDIAGHGSHENGRDVDIAFYMLGAGDQPFMPQGFAEFDANGQGVGGNRGLRFDDARNWELVAKLVSDGDARVQYVFVANHVKRRLLREARRRGAPAGVLDRADKAMVQPAAGHPHANHFHVRIYCSPADRPSCKDRAPFHPWYPGRPSLARLGSLGIGAL
jgi:penicillin-insensitive murein endopeptidase